MKGFRLPISLALSAAVHIAALIAFYFIAPGLGEHILTENVASRIRLSIQPRLPPSSNDLHPLPQPLDPPAVAPKQERSETSERAAASISLGRFYSVAELDELPEMKGEIDPDPQELRTFPDSGDVALTVFLDRQGRVIQVQAQGSELPDQFVRYAVESFSRAEFSPGTIKSIPVPVELHIILHFSPATQ